MACVQQGREQWGGRMPMHCVFRMVAGVGDGCVRMNRSEWYVPEVQGYRTRTNAVIASMEAQRLPLGAVRLLVRDKTQAYTPK